MEALYAALPRPAQALLHAFEASGHDLAHSAELVGMPLAVAEETMRQICETAVTVEDAYAHR